MVHETVNEKCHETSDGRIETGAQCLLFKAALFQLCGDPNLVSSTSTILLAHCREVVLYNIV